MAPPHLVQSSRGECCLLLAISCSSSNGFFVVPIDLSKMIRILLFGILSSSVYGADKIKPKQLLLSPENQYNSGIFDFNFLNPQQPSPQVPQYNFADPRQTLPRYQPQFLYYGGGPGQPFLLNPGLPPNNFLYPQPQQPQGPGVIYRNGPGFQPGGPVFVGGGPAGGFPNRKPAFTPPIEKDAEEIPTNPGRIPPFKPKKPVGKPEKLETFNETPAATEADGLEETEKPQPQPKTPNVDPIKPGHRYFVLNGQPLFNYPFSLYQPQSINPEDVLKYSQTFPNSGPQEVPVPVIPAAQNPAFQNPQLLQNPNLRNPGLLKPNFQNPAIFDGIASNQNGANGVLLNYDPHYLRNQMSQTNHQQVGTGNYLQNIPLNYPQSGGSTTQYNPQQQPQNLAHQDLQQISLANTPQKQVYFLQKQTNPSLNEELNKFAEVEKNKQQAPAGLFRNVLPLTVIPTNGQNVQIRVSSQDFNLQPAHNSEFAQYPAEIENDAIIVDAKTEEENKDDEAASTPTKRPLEPSFAQAGPGAIALAGPGGVAAAGPKATAFAGKEGMAVSSPKATAIAGPAEEQEDEDQEAKKELKKEKKEKYIRQRFRGNYQ
ncbi:hypothetical protein HHI36_004444 [Cryptolaemus montrouzieri]|uniref:DUF4774 domain-containing protein n=1 Tax=Cryptolaemus montrouzieri TaxID=559131 RepID=A0ABD2NRG9_9CUCU